MARAGVGYAVQVSTEKDDMEWSESAAHTAYPDIWYTLGVHPESEFGDDKIDFLDAMALRGVSAEGGAGSSASARSDWTTTGTAKTRANRSAFLKNRSLSQRSIPCLLSYIHATRSMICTMSFPAHRSERGILHCFSGNAQWAKRFLDLGFHISFAGNVTYKKSTDLHEAAAYVPSDRLFSRNRLSLSFASAGAHKKSSRVCRSYL